MNVSTTIVLGSYAQGMLDAAASRGVLTDQAAQTMIKGLVRAYEQSENLQINLPAPDPAESVP